jgi:hypothetical protein
LKLPDTTKEVPGEITIQHSSLSLTRQYLWSSMVTVEEMTDTMIWDVIEMIEAVSTMIEPVSKMIGYGRRNVNIEREFLEFEYLVLEVHNGRFVGKSG